MNCANKKTVILFTRIPHAGTTKTRMMPFLSEEECVNLHYSMMGDEIAEICKVANKLEVAYFDDDDVTDDDRDYFRSYLMQEVTIPYLTTPQRGRDIFKRMQNAFAGSFDDNRLSLKLLVGCDLPELNATDLNEAFEALSTCDVVLNPSDDGGYWLIGMKKFQKCVFEVTGDGASTVLCDTCKCCADNSLTFKLGRELRDLDVKDDLLELYNERERLQIDSLTRALLDNFDASRFNSSLKGK